MIDSAHDKTELILKKIEKHLSKIYTQAGEEIEAAALQYFNNFQKLDKNKQKLVADGKISQSEYLTWRKNKMLYGQRYKAIKEEMAMQLLHANETAVKYINEKLPEIYTLNYNSFADVVNNSPVLSGYSFTLTDSTTVRLLSLAGDKNLLPYKKLNPAKDIPWNMSKINSEILQGILQGDSIPKIAARMRNVENMNAAASVRTARTAVTGSENRGRLDSYKKAREDGVIMKKTWIATYGTKTRDWHRELHGVSVDIDKPFINSLGSIMYPGDPSAHPANVYNCRCTIVAKIIGFKKRLTKNGR